jgi:hypothetical protein
MNYISLGNGLLSTGIRVYKRVRVNHRQVYKLVSWIDKRCKCGKFVRKNSSSNICKHCSLIKRTIRLKKYSKKYFKEKYKDKNFRLKRKIQWRRWYNENTK